MRITIERTGDAQVPSKSSVELPTDDVSFDKLEWLFRQCAKGFGYPQAAVDGDDAGDIPE